MVPLQGVFFHHPLGFKDGTQTGRCWYTPLNCGFHCSYPCFLIWSVRSWVQGSKKLPVTPTLTSPGVPPPSTVFPGWMSTLLFTSGCFPCQQRMNVNPTGKRVPFHLLADFSNLFLANVLPPTSIISVIHLYLNLSNYAFIKNLSQNFFVCFYWGGGPIYGIRHPILFEKPRNLKRWSHFNHGLTDTVTDRVTPKILPSKVCASMVLRVLFFKCALPVFFIFSVGKNRSWVSMPRR